MDDSELEAIRQRRLAELSGNDHQNRFQGPSSSSVLSKLQPNSTSGADEQSKKTEQDEIRRTMISQIVDSDARERLSRIALVRPKRAREIEDMLIRMAQTGQLRGRVSEEQLIGVLDQIEKAEAGPIQSNTSSNKIKYVRKDRFDDDEDDF
ncbi:PDCD5-related protein [Phakopsora pachyrhizi]|uniref:PDCD5-related protein n=1 Tax=Phakopsora pachyrhizi TaxID=170000 RepID=A0AAV0BXC7_PHAPC|nr:PDCD5-related protein [Phakopsora pachyrhizi]